MAMKKSAPAANPDAYVGSLDGWRRRCVEHLRKAARSATEMEEVVKWGHLVYLSNGPVLLIRAEEERVLFGFWRGQRLRTIEPGLKPGGKTRWPRWNCGPGRRSILQPCTAWSRKRLHSTGCSGIRPT